VVEIPTYATRLDPVGRAARTRRLLSHVRAIWHSPQQRRFALALLAALGSTLVFARITEDYLTNDPLARWDVSLAGWLVEHRSAAGLDVFRTITNLGSPAVSLVIASFACVVLYRRQIAERRPAVPAGVPLHAKEGDDGSSPSGGRQPDTQLAEFVA